MAINKVEFGNQTLIDLTGDTATPEDVLEGKTFHTKSGNASVGTAGPYAGSDTNGGPATTAKKLFGQDTRSVNSPPSFYLASGQNSTLVTEFKNRAVIDAPGSSNFGTLITVTPWMDSSGGLPVQTYVDNTGQKAIRFAQTSETWGSWSTLASNSDIPSVGNGTIKLQRNGVDIMTFTTNQNSNVTGNLIIPTKVSELTNDSEFISDDDPRLTDSRNAKDVYAWAKASTKPSYTASEVGAIATSAKGANGGVAELDSAGKVPSSQLPSFVDDVLEYNSLSNFPTTGETGKIYIAKDTNKTYRWSGTTYVEISASLALGETSSTAYRGDRGKTAYDHSQSDHSSIKPAFTEASTRANIATGETLATMLGKIKKFFTDLKTVAFTGSYNDLTNKPTIPVGSDYVKKSGDTMTGDLTISSGTGNILTIGSTTIGDNGTINLYSAGGYRAILAPSSFGFSSNHLYEFPDQGGVIALTDDIPGVVSTSANGLAPKVTDTSKFLKGDGTWATPANTTYSAGTGISLSGTTFSNAGIRDISINGNYLRKNLNGTETDLTIPYATLSTTARKVVSVSARPATADTQYSDGGLHYYLASSYMTTSKPPADGAIVHLAWDNDGGYDKQLYIGHEGGTNTHAYVRSQNAKTWGSWTPVAIFNQTAPTSGQVVVTDGTSGSVKSSGYTIATSVPSNAVFTDTKNTAGSTDTSSKIFLIGATSQAANPQTYSDDQVYVTSGTLQANVVSASAGVNANTANSGSSGGVSLYNNNPAVYGIVMRNTGTSTGQLGKHGYVQGDWAGYLCFNGATNRGYIFRHSGNNIASISGEGHAVFNGSVTIGGNTANTSGARMQYNSTNQCIDFIFV